MRQNILPLLLLLWSAGCSSLPTVDHSVKSPLLSADSIVVFTRSGCPFCAETLELLQELGETPLVRDVSHDALAYQELLAIYREQFPGAKVIVPLIGKNNNYVSGFSRRPLLELLNNAPIGTPDAFDACD